ncbi:hypothetical protein GY45DRAFT_842204 [Cubamyces sp. BRFM 1775]|nr:hypothetical protein GY45DRAFT_842204 [Cubamyces sp. BRFM 1775]
MRLSSICSDAPALPYRDANGDNEAVVYRTETLLSQTAAHGIYGRGTRVWTARRVVNSSTEGQPLVVIKDYWVDTDRTREGDILYTLRSDVLTRDEKGAKTLLDHIPTVVHHGDVVISGQHDRTRSFEDIIATDSNGEHVSIDLEADINPTRVSADEGTSTHLSQTSCVWRPVRKNILFLDPKTHYRVVFHEYRQSLQDEKSLQAAFIAVRDVTRCLATLHRMSWVHRDISAGTILVVRDQSSPGQAPTLRGLLMDFELLHVGGSRQSPVLVQYGRNLEIPPPLISLPPFRYHPLNDWESLWWVSLYMIVYRVLAGTYKPGETFEEQLDVALTLFYDRGSRRSFLTVGRNELDHKLERCLHPDIRYVLDMLIRLRGALVRAYNSVENDCTEHPDPTRSRLSITSTFTRTIFAICQYLDSCRRLLIEPIPVPHWGNRC